MKANSLIFLGWAALIVAVAGAIVVAERRSLAAEFQAEAGLLHRLASQRADQHDAHLTSLSALAVAGAEDRPDLFLDVATTVLRFYPRITAVDLVPLAAGGKVISTRRVVPDNLIAAVRSAALEASGEIRLLPADGLDGLYLLIKRSPNSDAARFGLAMQIDAAALLASEDEFWQRPTAMVSLVLPDTKPETPDASQSGLTFEKPLGSASQPLLFRASIIPGLTGIFSTRLLLPALLMATLLYFVAVIGVLQGTKARRAERRARLSAQEARLAHASRVNILGEMASGMAHELTQPLTAILAQAQAGRHLSERGDTDGLRASLDNIIMQTRRAAALLDRLRNWSRPQRAPIGPVSVNSVAANVQMLLRADAEREGIGLELKLDPEVRLVRGDLVEMEQVVFNLVRNALDAVVKSDLRQIRIITRTEGLSTVLEVVDSGSGVAAEMQPRLFEPFVTGSAGGTGLGLALCKRLVERMGGDIALVAGVTQTTFRVTLPAMQDAGAGV